MVKKILTCVIKRYRLQQVVAALQIEDNINACNNQVSNNGGTFLPGASVGNQQNDPGKIVIGKGTNVAGLLLIFKYGGKILIGDYCYIGDHSRIWAGDSVTIGNNVFVSHNVNIMDTNSHELDANDRAYGFKKLLKNGLPLEKGNVETKPIVIEDHLWIGFNVIILKGVRIGKSSIIAAGSVVTKDIPANSIGGGNPGRVIKQIIDERT